MVNQFCDLHVLGHFVCIFDSHEVVDKSCFHGFANFKFVKYFPILIVSVFNLDTC